MIFLAAIGPFLLLNLLCACVALAVGFSAGVWFYGAKVMKQELGSLPKAPVDKPNQNEEAKRAVDRAVMAASRVADLASNVSFDVHDHAAKIQAISAELASVDRASNDVNNAVFTALDQMLFANSQLQERLVQAEKRLAAQAVEIKAHESEARTDSLTTLANRRAFDDELKRRLSEWERKRIPCTLALLDIDHFKKFNDTHGHQAGDEVLKQVAKVLKAQSRDSDLPCRYGGEEFGVILAATDAKSARAVAERIRAAIEESVTRHGSQMLKVTCSIGISQFEVSDQVSSVIRRADDALYASKEAGRNCGHWKNQGNCLPLNVDAEVSANAAASSSQGSEDTATSIGAFVQMLKRTVADSHRFGIPLCVMHLKIDELDIVTQKYGIGVARQMSDIAEPVLHKVLGEANVLAKIDVGEFLVMLPGRTKGESQAMAKKMQAAAANCVMPFVDRELHLTLLEGVAELHGKELAPELVARARQATQARYSIEA